MWDAIAVAGWAALLIVMLETNYRRQQYLLPWLILAIDAAAFRGRWWPWLVCRPAVYLIGGMCYTIYLYHTQFGSLLMPITSRVHAGSNYSVNCATQVAILVAATIAGCSTLFVLLEKPFMRRDWTTAVLRFVTGRRAAPIGPDAPVPGLPASGDAPA